jgi:ribose-phosphate pyrophosphokinase
MIKLFNTGGPVEFKQWKFPGGEVGVKLPTLEAYEHYTVTCTLPTSDDLFVLFNLLNALSINGVHRNRVTVAIPYVPYGRQDRACETGESYALEVFTSLIKSQAMYFNKLVIEDPHSAKTVELLESPWYDLVVYSQSKCARYLPYFDALIAPDKGAAEKAKTHFQVNAHDVPVYTLNKVRLDGRVIYEEYPYDTISGNVCVVDDICDGGATFLSLAEMLTRTQPRVGLSLYVTHGLFSKGVADLKRWYDTIYCRNILNPLVADSGAVTLV